MSSYWPASPKDVTNDNDYSTSRKINTNSQTLDRIRGSCVQ